MKKLRSPIRYFGGKGTFFKNLLALFPTHSTYVEPFAGGASLLFAKSPSSSEVINDIHPGLMNLYRVLQDPQMFNKLMELLRHTPYSREEFYRCRETWMACNDPVEKARMYLVVMRMCFSGVPKGGFSFSVKAIRSGMAWTTSQWLSIIDLLPQIHERLKSVKVEQEDFRQIIQKYDAPDTFFYLDPPYVLSTRKTSAYEHEMSDQDHGELIEMLLDMQGKAILSGYSNGLYVPLEDANWTRTDYPVFCSAAGKTKRNEVGDKRSFTEQMRRTESVWISPNCDEHKILLP